MKRDMETEEGKYILTIEATPTEDVWQKIMDLKLTNVVSVQTHKHSGGTTATVIIIPKP